MPPYMVKCNHKETSVFPYSVHTETTITGEDWIFNWTKILSVLIKCITTTPAPSMSLSSHCFHAQSSCLKSPYFPKPLPLIGCHQDEGLYSENDMFTSNIAHFPKWTPTIDLQIRWYSHWRVVIFLEVSRWGIHILEISFPVNATQFKILDYIVRSLRGQSCPCNQTRLWDDLVYGPFPSCLWFWDILFQDRNHGFPAKNVQLLTHRSQNSCPGKRTTWWGSRKGGFGYFTTYS